MFQPITSIQPNRSNSWTTLSKDQPLTKSVKDPTIGTNVFPEDIACTPSIGLSMAQGLTSIITPASEFTKNVLDYFTGLPNWGKNLSSDICDGRIGAQAAGGTMRMVGRTLGSAIGGRVAFWIGAASIASGSLPALLAGGALAGGVMLASPAVGEKLISIGKDLFNTFVKSVGDNSP
jgi:hypothetical protein